ncbi:MAG: TRAP transporter small permease [Candidatus Marinimicrobia bacterium]|nr:TRAP transporter small permease [Candidatus Neomarinimicrobiota bacterium]
MKWLIKSERVFTRLMEFIISFFFLGIIIMVITLVVLRYGFNTTIVGGNELVVILFIYTSAIGAAVIVGKKEHIAITYFIDKLPPFPKKLVNIFNLLMITLLNGAMIVYSIPWISRTGNYLTAVLGIPQIFSQIIVPIGCGMAILYCLFHIVLALSPNRIEV